MSLLDKVKNLFNEKFPKKLTVDEIRDKYRYLVKNSIRIKSKDECNQELTYLGGTPKVPKDFKWPYYEDTDLTLFYALSFIAQFDCEDLALCDSDNLLPQEGILSFFYSVESSASGSDPNEEGAFKVYWFPNAADLVDIDYPDDLPESFRYSKVSLSLSRLYSYPPLNSDLPRDVDRDEYKKLKNYLFDKKTEVSKFLGYPDEIYSKMERDCELVSKGYYYNNHAPEEVSKYADEHAREEWQLLLQFDFRLIYTSRERLYFFIRKEDLKNKDFSKTWFILDDKE